MQRWPALLNRKEAAEYLGVSASQVSILISSGKLKGVKFFSNSHPKYKKSDLDLFVESLEYGQGHCSATQGSRN